MILVRLFVLCAVALTAAVPARAADSMTATDSLRAEAPADARKGVPGLGDPVNPADPSRPCVPTLAASPKTACAFNVWGFVRDKHGIPVAGATVSDGTTTIKTKRNGFFDLYQSQPGTHRMRISTRGGCTTTTEVTVDAYEGIANGGKQRNVRLPCAPPTYNAFGFGVVQQGSLIAVARSGVQHSGESGSLEIYSPTDDSIALPQLFADTSEDDRDAAGGLTRSGALVVFYARFHVEQNRWSSIGFVHTTKTQTTTGDIPAGRNTAFSPYGPLVVLPSGRLMQTFYGHDGKTWRVYTSFSSDDGLSWSRLIPIDVAPPYRTTEAAAAFIAGATDDTAKLVLVTRADGGRKPNRWYGLVQYVSSDGGRSWERRGLIRATATTRECMPWLMAMSGGRVAMVWADRGSMTLKRSIAATSDAFAARWPSAAVMYRSAVAGSPDPDIGDFGYPSIASYGSRDDQKAVVFNDVDPNGSDRFHTDVDLYVLPLWASPSRKPVAISP